MAILGLCPQQGLWPKHRWASQTLLVLHGWAACFLNDEISLLALHAESNFFCCWGILFALPSCPWPWEISFYSSAMSLAFGNQLRDLYTVFRQRLSWRGFTQFYRPIFWVKSRLPGGEGGSLSSPIPPLMFLSWKLVLSSLGVSPNFFSPPLFFTTR